MINELLMGKKKLNKFVARSEFISIYSVTQEYVREYENYCEHCTTDRQLTDIAQLKRKRAK